MPHPYIFLAGKVSRIIIIAIMCKYLDMKNSSKIDFIHAFQEVLELFKKLRLMIYLAYI